MKKETEIFCRKCGTENKKGAKFCVNCGEKLGGREKKNILIGSGVIVAGVFLIVMFSMLMGDSKSLQPVGEYQEGMLVVQQGKNMDLWIKRVILRFLVFMIQYSHLKME